MYVHLCCESIFAIVISAAILSSKKENFDICRLILACRPSPDPGLGSAATIVSRARASATLSCDQFHMWSSAHPSRLHTQADLLISQHPIPFALKISFVLYTRLRPEFFLQPDPPSITTLRLQITQTALIMYMSASK